MGKFGISISGCMGDIINITPTIKYFSRCHNQKLYLETNLPHLFKNNPYIEKIYDVNKGEKYQVMYRFMNVIFITIMKTKNK